MAYLAIVLFVIIFILILRGYPVAFTLGGISVAFAYGVSLFAPEVFQMSTFYLLPSRIMGVVNNYVFMAVGVKKELLQYHGFYIDGYP